MMRSAIEDLRISSFNQGNYTLAEIESRELFWIIPNLTSTLLCHRTQISLGKQSVKALRSEVGNQRGTPNRAIYLQKDIVNRPV